MGSKLEAVTEKALFSSRWILAPIFLGLSLALMALGIKFFQEAYHLIAEVLVKDEADLVLKVLALIDISLVGSLIVMVMFSGYENFVSTIDAKGTTRWAGSGRWIREPSSSRWRSASSRFLRSTCCAFS